MAYGWHGNEACMHWLVPVCVCVRAVLFVWQKLGVKTQPKCKQYIINWTDVFGCLDFMGFTFISVSIARIEISRK